MKPIDFQAAAARALSERWNRRQGKCIYPSNSTAEDWLASGDAQAATAAVLREMLDEDRDEAGQRLYVLLAYFDRRDGSYMGEMVRAAREGWERSHPDMDEDDAWDEFDRLWDRRPRAASVADLSRVPERQP